MEFKSIIEKGFGIDVHQKMIMVNVQGKGIKKETREFSTFTEDIEKCKDWLKSLGLEYGAMESTGVYWKPVFNILGEDFKLILVNARHIKNVPGRKTDVKDAEWICKLLISGLLKASFVPPEVIRNARDIFRYKTKMVEDIAREKNRVQRILEDANIKLSSVVSDVFGSTGQKILKMLLAGETDPDKIVRECYHGKLKTSREDIKKALKGRFTEHHHFMITQMFTHIANTEKQITELENRLDILLSDYKTEIDLLQDIPGIDKTAAVGIISEIGTDMTVFKNEHHLSSWAGMCPGNNESAGKKKSSRTTQGDKYLKVLLVQIAWAATRSKKTFYRAKYESLVIRRGKKRALIAVGHKILCSIYHVISKKEKYKELGNEFLEQRKLNSRIKNLTKQLDELGYEIVIKQTA
jgi:transposase